MKLLEINGVEFNYDEIIHNRFNEDNTEVIIVLKAMEGGKGIKAVSSLPLNETKITFFNHNGDIILEKTGFKKLSKFLITNEIYGYGEKIVLTSSTPMI